MNFYATILASRRQTILLVALAVAHLLLIGAAVYAIIRYQQFWALIAVLWLPLIILAFRWTVGKLYDVFSGRDDDVLATDEVRISEPPASLLGETLTNVAEELAVATGEAQPRAALCESEAVNAFIAYPEADGKRTTTVVFTTAMAEKLSRQELSAVTAHLFIHRRDFEQMLARMAGAMFLAVFAGADLFLLLNVLNWNLGGSSDFSTGPLVVALVLGMLMAPVAAAAWAQAFALRRTRLLDDLRSLEITNDPDSLAGALGKLAEPGPRLRASYRMADVHFYFDAVDDVSRKWPWQRFRTHPGPGARIRALKAATGAGLDQN